MRVFILIVLLTSSAVLLSACAEESSRTPTNAPEQPTATPLPTTPTFSPLAITPFVQAAAAPPTPACVNVPQTRLIVEERGMVSDEDENVLNVRQEPGTEGTKILGVLEVYDTFLVREGPRCADGYAWFRVEGLKVNGWIAEGDFDVYYVEPYLAG
ncbi:MAG: hypothetical protein OHK0046_09940 [Anaerolineae bacterium]